MSELSERRSDLFGEPKTFLVDRVVELEDRESLAHEIAEDDSKSVLDSMLGISDDGEWLNLRDRAVGCDFFIDRAIQYLDAEGILKRHPADPDLVGWDEMEVSK